MILTRALREASDRYPKKIALVVDGCRYDYQRIYLDSVAFSANLYKNGFRKGDRVMVFLDNRYEAIVSIYGTLFAGGIFIPVNPETKGRKLQYILENSDARFVVTDRRRYLEKVELLRTSSIILVDGGEGVVLDFNMMVEFPKEMPDITVIDADIASIIYTSGSTGIPKGVTMTHLSICTAIESITTYLSNTPDDIVINVLPISFDYGLYQVLMTFHFGGTLILEKNFVFFSNIIKRIREEKVTGFPLVPAIAEIMLKMKDFGKEDLGSLRYITNTAQKLPERTIRGLKEKLPSVKLYSMYGLTECKRIAYLDPEKVLLKPNSVGKAMPNTEVFLVDDEGRRIDVPNNPGELVVRGSNVMKGYWNNEFETAKVLKEGYYPLEKVLFTGDLFRFDEDGDLYFISRKDDMFKIGGEKVSPREVEDTIFTLEGVREAAVFGKEDPLMGNSLIVVASVEGLDEEMIRAHCARNLEKYLVPRDIIILDSLPRNENGKVDRKLLKEMYS
ncbi:MAG: acyl--CoA ligase [Candidatus Thermoplasmatota archaeon]|nr:acyl--CoA ligase [Candidatus Thermoplasmatota archaeon]